MRLAFRKIRRILSRRPRCGFCSLSVLYSLGGSKLSINLEKNCLSLSLRTAEQPQDKSNVMVSSRGRRATSRVFVEFGYYISLAVHTVTVLNELLVPEVYYNQKRRF